MQNAPAPTTSSTMKSIVALTLVIYFLNYHLVKAAVSNLHLRAQRCIRNVTNISYNTTEGSVTVSRQLALVQQNCLMLKLPYEATTIPDYTPGLNLTTIDEVQNYLQRWQIIEKLPKCWPFIQRALCSVLMPRYDEDLGPGRPSRITRPNFEICNDVKKNCKFIERNYGWSSIFNCTDTNLYARNCTNELRDIKPSDLLMVDQSICPEPLVPSNDTKSWFRDIHGCALSCKYPLSEKDSQVSLNLFIRVLSISGLVSSSIAIILFAVSEANKKSSRIARVVKRCNICQFFLYLGWSLQVFYNENLACSSDGLALYGLPLVANACVLSFFLTYLPSLTNLFWCAYLGKLCCEKLNDGEKKPPRDLKLSRALDLLSYSIPALLFSMVALLGEIDGHGLFGICTVGQRSPVMKTIFVFVPKISGNLIGCFYFFNTIINLVRVKPKSSSLWRNFTRIAVLATLNTTDIMFSIGNYMYDYNEQGTWMESINDYIVCNLDPENNLDADLTTKRECMIRAKPFVALYYLEVLSSLAMGIVIASWACCETNFRSLRTKLIYLLETERDRKRRECYKLVKSAESNGQTFDLTSINPESCHDMIDMTSPNQTEPEVELRNEQKARETPSDLGSCTISQGSNTSRIDYQRHLNRHRNLTKTSRDVINDQRLRQQLLERPRAIGPTEALLAEPPPFDFQLPTNFLDLFRTNCLMNRLDQFNPIDPSRLEASVNGDLNIMHGMVDCPREKEMSDNPGCSNGVGS